MKVIVKNHCPACLSDSYYRTAVWICRLTISYTSGNRSLPILAVVHGSQARQWPLKLFLREIVPPCAAPLCCYNASDLEVYRVAASPVVALMFVPHHQPDLIPLDLSVSGIDGMTFIAYLYSATADAACPHCLPSRAHAAESHRSGGRNLSVACTRFTVLLRRRL